MKRTNKLTIRTILFFGVLSILLLSGCTKDNSLNVHSEQGITGGDGTALLSGDGAPANNLGKNDNFYLDKTNLTIYGPKTNAGWGEGTPLKGDNGKDGSKILSGEEVPTTNLGDIGDFYFDTQNIAIYGPKTVEGWGNPVSLRAPSGLDVTVLMYREHSFQTVTWNEDEWGSREWNMQSIIPIDSRYQDAYDNGITLVQIRQSNRTDSYWSITSTMYSREDKGKYIEVYLNIDDDKYYRPWDEGNSIQKDKIIVYGYASEGYTETEIKAFEIDIKIVFIPATSVIEMTAKNIDIRDTSRVSEYLGL